MRQEKEKVMSAIPEKEVSISLRETSQLQTNSYDSPRDANCKRKITRKKRG